MKNEGGAIEYPGHVDIVDDKKVKKLVTDVEPPDHVRRVVGALIAVALLATLIVLAPVEEWVIQFVEWVDGAGPVGLAAFGLFYVFGAVVFVPATFLSLSAGFLFGLTNGLLLVALCIPLGALMTFVVGRYLARDMVQTKVQDLPKFHAMERAISMEGFKMAFLTRLVPILPFTLLNYLFGVTRVGTRRFLLATTLGMIPTSVAYVYVGAMAGDLKRALAMGDSPGPATFLMWTAGVLAVVVIVWLITRRARQELEFLMRDEQGSVGEEDVEDSGAEVV